MAPVSQKGALISWSSGKDSVLCLVQLLRNRTHIRGLVTTLTEEKKEIAFHGVSDRLVQFQAQSLGLPLHTLDLADVKVGSSLFHFLVQMRHDAIISIGSYISSKKFQFLYFFHGLYRIFLDSKMGSYD